MFLRTYFLLFDEMLNVSYWEITVERKTQVFKISDPQLFFENANNDVSRVYCKITLWCRGPDLKPATSGDITRQNPVTPPFFRG
jgi:hypothetical protein